GEKARIVAKCVGKVDFRSAGLHIEANRVGDVEDFPPELKALLFRPRHSPALGKVKVHVEESLPAELIARSARAWERRLKAVDGIRAVADYSASLRRPEDYQHSPLDVFG